MNGWIHSGLIPKFVDGRFSSAGHGVIESLWLGGLANPQAFISALRLEHAILNHCSPDEVNNIVCLSSMLK